MMKDVVLVAIPMACAATALAVAVAGGARADDVSCSYTGDSVCANDGFESNVRTGENVPLHCWGLVNREDGSITYYELSGDTGVPASRTTHTLCTDSGVFTAQDRSAMYDREHS